MAKIEVTKLATFSGHKDAVFAMTEGERPGVFFTSGSDKLVAMWDLADPDNGRLVAKVENTVYSLCYLQGKNALIIGQNNEGIHEIDLHERKESRSLKLTKEAIFDIKYFDQKLFVAAGDGVVYVVDHTNWAIIKKLAFSQQNARSVIINPLQHELIVGYSDNFIRIFDLGTYQLKKAIQAHKLSVFSLAFTPGFNYLLSGGRDAHLNIWDAENDYQFKEGIVAHMYTINHIAFRKDGKFFATCSKDKSIKVWDTEHFKLLKVIDKARHAGHGTSVNKLLWVGDENRIVSCSDDRSISVWQLKFNPLG